jgi:hypothetical protein
MRPREDTSAEPIVCADVNKGLIGGFAQCGEGVTGCQAFIGDFEPFPERNLIRAPPGSSEATSGCRRCRADPGPCS